MKIPLTVLTFRRPAYLARTLASFAEFNGSGMDRFQIRVLVQGGPDKETMAVLESHKEILDNVTVSKQNAGVSAGWSRLMREALSLGSPYVFHLEDDWKSTESVLPYLDEVLGLLDREPGVGQVRLRSSLERVCGTNPFAGEKIRWQPASTHLKIGNAHLTFNPAITRSGVIARIAPATSEKDAAMKYQALGLWSGQLLARCFVHIGAERAITTIDGKRRYLR